MTLYMTSQVVAPMPKADSRMVRGTRRKTSRAMAQMKGRIMKARMIPALIMPMPMGGP